LTAHNAEAGNALNSRKLATKRRDSLQAAANSCNWLQLAANWPQTGLTGLTGLTGFDWFDRL